MRESTAGLADTLANGSKANTVLLELADVLFASIVVAPAVVTYWKSTWSLMDLYVLPEMPKSSAAACAAFGLCCDLVFCVFQNRMSKYLRPDRDKVTYYVLSRLYTFIAGAACVGAWRGVWNLLNECTGDSARTLMSTTVAATLSLAALRTLRNICAAPFAVAVDSPQDYFNVPTMFRTEQGAFECDICKYRFRDAKLLEKHQAMRHSTRFTCNMCEFTTTYTWASSRRGLDVDDPEWQEAEKKLDRAWYNMGEGETDESDPFAGTSAEYVAKKEEQIEKRRNRKVSAARQQIDKDNELWERNRMLTSGVVHAININNDMDEESVDRVHLLVHNIVPPFLDGRIVFTKQPEPVIPVKDPTSDMAMNARKGSALVKAFREQKERRKAQKKHWKLEGTKIGQYIKVKNDMKKWSGTLEHIMGNTLRSFCVNSIEDSKKLFKIMDQVLGTESKPSVTCSKFLAARHDVRRGSVLARPHCNALQALDVDDPVVANFLVTLDCTEYFPAPHYRSYGGRPRVPKFLHHSNAERTQQLMTEIEEMRQSSQAQEKQAQKLQEELQRAQRGERTAATALQALGAHLCRLETDEREAAAELELLQTPQRSVLEEELNITKQSVETIRENLKGLKKQDADVIRELSECDAKVQAALDEVTQATDNCRKLTEHIDHEQLKMERKALEQTEINLLNYYN